MQSVRKKYRKNHAYHTWAAMKDRCYNPGHVAYHRYGGRGITICDEWLHSFDAFYKWALRNGYSPRLTIDRINNDDGYYPENCRWVDILTQHQNRSGLHLVSINGETKSIAAWSRAYGIRYLTVMVRICRWWDEVVAITTPTRHGKRAAKKIPGPNHGTW